MDLRPRSSQKYYSGRSVGPFWESHPFRNPGQPRNFSPAARFTPQQEASSLPSVWSMDLRPRSSQKYYSGRSVGPFWESHPFRNPGQPHNFSPAARFTPQQGASSLPSVWSMDLRPRSSQKYYSGRSVGPFWENHPFRNPGQPHNFSPAARFTPQQEASPLPFQSSIRFGPPDVPEVPPFRISVPFWNRTTPHEALFPQRPDP
jgi:hypothetical protein